MYIAFHLGWWIIPALIFVFSILMLGHKSTSSIGRIGLWIAAIFVLGHYITVLLR